MIPVAEIRALQAEWQLRDDVIEKDYALGWVLAGIAAEPDLKNTWIFKGGTALRKCYFETYRLSEDLDFSLTPEGPDDPDQLVPIFHYRAKKGRSGPRLVEPLSLRRAKNEAVSIHDAHVSVEFLCCSEPMKTLS